MGREGTRDDHRERVLRALRFVQKELSGPLDVDGVAKAAAMSPFHFSRVFRALMGESVMAHVRRLRLERAAHRLHYSDVPVGEVGLEAGYDAHEAFTRAFGALLGCSPLEYRRRHRTADVPGAPNEVHWALDPEAIALRPVPAPAELPIVVATKPEVRVAAMRHRGSYFEAEDTWGRMMVWASDNDVPVKTGYGVYHDDPELTPVAELRYDACLPVPAGFVARGGVEVVSILGGDWVTTSHQGSAWDLPQLHVRLVAAWLARGDRALADEPAVETYFDDPRVTPESEQRFEIAFRLEDRGGQT